MNLYQKIAAIKGYRLDGEEIFFELNIKEIKHIRRCMKAYDYHHPIDESNMQKDLLDKFEQFGNLRNRSNRILDMVKGTLPLKCSVEGCDRKDLQVHHVIPLSAHGDDNELNMQFLCPFHHTLFHIGQRITWKEKELDYLKELREKYIREEDL